MANVPNSRSTRQLGGRILSELVLTLEDNFANLGILKQVVAGNGILFAPKFETDAILASTERQKLICEASGIFVALADIVPLAEFAQNMRVDVSMKGLAVAIYLRMKA